MADSYVTRAIERQREEQSAGNASPLQKNPSALFSAGVVPLQKEVKLLVDDETGFLKGLLQWAAKYCEGSF
ncbi:hypothetical protein WOLCODRAFT_157064 [Wolfiporia cocos MD-104 SS10]|uniref:Uncharacterized protein n=1 Tax=Wolfiporia cocos (strain MD-104) TaxID=742152 RepID=A0A2H3JI45_WOLCO|nr:hypothetical protein WOLCODRAFT_157064 [Wolfiporia cocos MD-104 SS10]